MPTPKLYPKQNVATFCIIPVQSLHVSLPHVVLLFPVSRGKLDSLCDVGIPALNSGEDITNLDTKLGHLEWGVWRFLLQGAAEIVN